MTRRRT